MESLRTILGWIHRIVGAILLLNFLTLMVGRLLMSYTGIQPPLLPDSLSLVLLPLWALAWIAWLGLTWQKGAEWKTDNTFLLRGKSIYWQGVLTFGMTVLGHAVFWWMVYLLAASQGILDSHATVFWWSMLATALWTLEAMRQPLHPIFIINEERIIAATSFTQVNFALSEVSRFHIDGDSLILELKEAVQRRKEWEVKLSMFSPLEREKVIHRLNQQVQDNQLGDHLLSNA